MSFLYVSEFTNFGRDISMRVTKGAPVAQPPIAEQKLVNTGGSVVSAAFNAKTRIVRMHTDSICSIKIGSGTPVATTNTGRLAAGTTEYFAIDASGHAVSPLSVAVIANT